MHANDFRTPTLDRRTNTRPLSGRRAGRLVAVYMTVDDATICGPILLSVLVFVAAGCGRCERNQPAESQARGMTNSDQPQSKQTWMSGEGVIGGWLNVWGLLRNRRTSAGTIETAADWHLGQTIEHLGSSDKHGIPKKSFEGVIQSNGIAIIISTGSAQIPIQSENRFHVMKTNSN